MTLNQRLACEEFIRASSWDHHLLGRDWTEGGCGWRCDRPHGELHVCNRPLELTPVGAWRLDFHVPASTCHRMQVDPGKRVRLWLRWLHSASLRAIPKGWELRVVGGQHAQELGGKFLQSCSWDLGNITESISKGLNFSGANGMYFWFGEIEASADYQSKLW